MPIRVSFIIKIILIFLLFIIKASADKLKREMEDFGFPPKFPADVAEETEEEKAATPKESESSKIDNKSKSKKVLSFIHNVKNFDNYFYSNRVKQQRRVLVKNINGK